MPLLLNASDFVVDTTWSAAEFGSGSDEEASSWEHSSLDVGKEALAQRNEALPSWSGGLECRGHDFDHEAVARGVDCGELQILLRAKQGVDAALCHSSGVSQLADGETIETLDGRELCRALDDTGTSLVARGAGALRRCWLCQ